MANTKDPLAAGDNRPFVNLTRAPVLTAGCVVAPSAAPAWMAPDGTAQGLPAEYARHALIVTLDVAEAALLENPERADLYVPHPFGGVCRPAQASPALRAARRYEAIVAGAQRDGATASAVERAIRDLRRPDAGEPSRQGAAAAYAHAVADIVERSPIQDHQAVRVGTRAGWARACGFILDQLRRAAAPAAYLDLVAGMATDPLCGKPSALPEAPAPATYHCEVYFYAGSQRVRLGVEERWPQEAVEALAAAGLAVNAVMGPAGSFGALSPVVVAAR
jgi:hypothetical protein